MYFAKLVFSSVSLGLFAEGAFAQYCQPGTPEWNMSIQCACDKDPLSDQCKLYKQNKSLYDGKGLQPSNAVPSVRRAQQAVVQQDRTPISPTLLPAETPFWQMVPAGTRIAIGMRPQWLTASPLFDQLLGLGGRATGQKMSVEDIKREMANVETVIIAVTRSGGTPLILARAADVVRTTKSERDPYRYVDPNTILVGDPAQTNAAMRRLFSQESVSSEARMAGRVAAWSAVWVVADPMVAPAAATQLSGVTKMTVGLSMHDGLTMEVWLDAPSAAMAKNLTARLQKNPHEAPLFGQMGGAAIVEQRDNSVRIYVHTGGNLTGSTAPVEGPAATTVKRSQFAEIQNGMDRAAVEAAVGKPNSTMAIQGTDDAIETLIYNLEDKATARIRMVNRKVVSVQFVD